MQNAGIDGLKRPKHRSDRVEPGKELDTPLFGLQSTPEGLITFFRNRTNGPIHDLAFSVVEDGMTVGYGEAHSSQARAPVQAP